MKRRWSLGRIGLLTAFLVFSGISQVVAAPGDGGPPSAEFTFQPQRYYVFSADENLKGRFGVQHQFQGVFSTVLSPIDVEELTTRGLRVEPVGLFSIVGPPSGGCNNDGKCQGWEDPTCGDCAGGGGDTGGTTGSRTCTPDNQTPWGIDMVYGDPATAYQPSGGAGVTVAVLDTGAEVNHLDLQGRVADCKDATRKGGIKGGCNDTQGHGTHVAGTILADGGSDGQGVYGVAPEASLMAIKVCGGAFCWGDDMALGIRYAADHSADIISMSIGGDSPDPLVIDAIDYAVARDVLVVAAAGNDGPSLGSIDYPGAYHQVVAAAAINVYEEVADWSSRGVNDGDYLIEEREVELATPGVSVESTYKDGCYAYMSGTSMATPHLSGVAAKVWSGSAASTRAFLHSIAQDIWTSGDDAATGIGLPQVSP